MFGELWISHTLVWALGFGMGGVAAYKLIMYELEKSVESMFSFGQGSDLIDEIVEEDQDE